MRYLKYFENISTLEVSKFTYVYKFDIKDIKFYVNFSKSIFDKVFIRRYDECGDKFKENYNNPREIILHITDITKLFINKTKPNAIIIPHISMKNEVGELNTPNKRARFNYNYLKDIKGYNLEYYNVFYRKPNEKSNRTRTYCFLLKNGYSIDPNNFFTNLEFKKVIINNI